MSKPTPDELGILSLSEADRLKLLSRLKRDYAFYAPRVLKVQTMESKLAPFELNKPQKTLHDMVERIKAVGRPIRIIALKARRMGFSTYFSGRYYHKVTWSHNKYATQITHEPEATDTLFKMVKRFYAFTPKQIRPGTVYNNVRLLEFNTKDGKGLNSGFRVATAAKEDFGSGQLLHFVHLSESSKWDVGNVENLLTSILQCVPDDPDTEVVFESTAKGIGGDFYNRFWGARYRLWVEKLDENGQPIIKETINESADPNNIYTSIFLPWYVFEKYQMKLPKDFCLQKSGVMENDEFWVKRHYGLSDEQIYWRRMTIANKCNGSSDTFNQEYPANPIHAFLGSGRPVFDNVKLLKLRDAALPPVARYECLLGLQQFMSKEDGRLKVWKEPKRGRAYIVSADVAEGLLRGDYSVVDVVDHLTGEQVAHFHAHIDPDELGLFVVALAKRYNDAWVAVERNNHGLTTLTAVINQNYPNVYAEMVPEPPGKPRKRYGWVTSNATRPLIIDNLIKEVREDSHGIVCKETFEEMMTFKRQDNGKLEADEGMHDDRVMSIAIAKFMRQVLDLPSIRSGKFDHYKKVRGRGGKRVKPPVAGWT